MKKVTSALISFATCAAVMQAQTIVYDFNDSVTPENSSWSTDFQTTATSNLFTASNESGVGGTGAVVSNSGSQVWSATGNSFAGNFAELSMSIAFEWNASPSGNGDFTIGFATDNPGTYGGSGIPNNSLAGGFQLAQSADTIRLEHQYRDTGGGMLNRSGNRALTVGQWYELEVNWTYNSTDGYDGDITLYNFDSLTGDRGVPVGGTMDFGLTNGSPNEVPSALQTALSSDDSVWAFIGGRSVSGQPIIFDNFTVSVTPVPEPSSYALIAGALALGFIVTRRRS